MARAGGKEWRAGRGLWLDAEDIIGEGGVLDRAEILESVHDLAVIRVATESRLDHADRGVLAALEEREHLPWPDQSLEDEFVAESVQHCQVG